VRASPSPQSAAELAAYYRFKWSIAAKTAIVALAVSLAVLPWNRYAALALGVGFACGIANALGIMRGSERLVESRNPAVFGLSSLLRLAGFSIVAAALAARGPWWSLGPFLAGFFFPLAAYALGASRYKPSTDR
jgi:hypothetical protein